MKRNKEFIRNSIILCFLLFLIMIFGNFYFSEEKCVEEVMKAMYMDEVLSKHESLTENHYTIINHEEKSVFTVPIKKYGIVYRYNEISGNEIIYMDDEHSVDITGYLYTDKFYDEKICTIYRNDEQVTTIEIEYPNKTVEICQEWKGNFCTFQAIKDEAVPATYYIYDENHELIEIIEY